MSKNVQKSPKMSKNVQKSPKMSKNVKKCPKMSKNVMTLCLCLEYGERFVNVVCWGVISLLICWVSYPVVV